VVRELERRRELGAESEESARHAHCCGLVAGNDSYQPLLLTAIRLAAAEPFWEARAQLALGSRLRRGRRRVDARQSLRAAHTAFEQMGARTWAQQARTEIAATGETARRRVPGSREDLTSQELRVALAAATGATNRAVAAQLFISPKTVEHHLSQVYRKLAIRSREDLLSRLNNDTDREQSTRA
jgi:DNA-binding NarL/FixJ family response regulator